MAGGIAVTAPVIGSVPVAPELVAVSKHIKCEATIATVCPIARKYGTIHRSTDGSRAACIAATHIDSILSEGH